MAVTDTADITQITTDTSTGVSHNFENNVSGVYIKVTTDTYIAFDREATEDDFLLSATDLVTFFEVPCTQVHTLAKTSNGTAYVIGRR